MSKEKAGSKAVVKGPAGELKYRIELPDGQIIEGTERIRQFAPNIAKGFQNSGYQCKLSAGNFNGSLMIIDRTKQVLL